MKIREEALQKEDFNLWDVAIVDWAPKDLEQELGACEIQLALAKFLLNLP